ncbi:MAG TPA: M28 family peptidase [Cytophagaceae bacterium]|jgi:glutaminyl-peptide cyclotransferase|nr:M28 family peptidase [Cytophagaceae bacterium]
MNKLSKHRYFFSLGLIFTVLLSSCEENSKKDNSVIVDKVEEKVVIKAPDFNQDSAYFFIEKQLSFGPRIPNTSAHILCSDYLVQRFKKYGAKVIEQDFQAKAYDGKMLRSKNIIASINPEATKRILLASHWDTRPWSDQDKKNPSKAFDGANDPGSGVGILLEIIRTIYVTDKKPSVGIDVVFFDSEDYGKSEVQDSYCLGSQYWSTHKHVANYSAYYGILLDMAGAKNARFNKEGVSMEYAPSIVHKVWDQASALGYGQYFIPQTASSITDDHYYVNTLAKIPMIDIVDYDNNVGFGSYWHTQDDNIMIIDKNTLKAVGQTLLQVLYNE